MPFWFGDLDMAGFCSKAKPISYTHAIMFWCANFPFLIVQCKQEKHAYVCSLFYTFRILSVRSCRLDLKTLRSFIKVNSRFWAPFSRQFQLGILSPKNGFVTTISTAVHRKLCIQFCIKYAKFAVFAELSKVGLGETNGNFLQYIMTKRKVILLFLSL